MELLGNQPPRFEEGGGVRIEEAPGPFWCLGLGFRVYRVEGLGFREEVLGLGVVRLRTCFATHPQLPDLRVFVRDFVCSSCCVCVSVLLG